MLLYLIVKNSIIKIVNSFNSICRTTINTRYNKEFIRYF